MSGGGSRGWDLIGRDAIVRELNNIVLQVLRGEVLGNPGKYVAAHGVTAHFEFPEMGLLVSHRCFRSLNIFILAYNFWFPSRRTIHH